MAIINKINANNEVYDIKGSLLYGVCGTAANVAAKEVTVDGNFSLYTGATVLVKFTYANSITEPTLNVNGTGDIPMKRYGTTVISTGTTSSGWVAGAVSLFVYDGTDWVREYWYNTTYSNASLGQGYAVCSTAAATVAKAATISSYALTVGGVVSIKFTNAVPANATLNIRTRGAKPIFYRGAKIVAGVINAGDIATFIYDGTNYNLISIDYQNATTTTDGLMSAEDKAKLDGITASADSVSFSRSLTSGTKIGTITINGTGTDIYAPTATEAADSTYIGTTDPGISSGYKIWIDPTEISVASADAAEF